jgi:FHA domain
MMLDIPFWWILGAAAALAALWVVRVFGASLNTKIFVHFVQKIIREKNVSRAVKLSSAAGDAPLGTATKAALLASVSREDDANRPAGYRGSRPVSMDAVRGRIRSHYDLAFTQSLAPVNQSFYIALPTPLLFLGTTYVAFGQPDPDWKIIGIAGAGLLFWLYVGWTYSKIVSSRNAEFESLWPSFETLYHDRHTLSIENKPAYPWTETPVPAVKNPQITFEISEPGKPLRTLALDQSIIKIGNLATSHVQLSGEGVARMHAVIEIADGKATIIDLGAEKQTRVNLENVNKRELGNGDVIGIGDVELVVRLGARDVTG